MVTQWRPRSHGAFAIAADDRESLSGYWAKSFSVTGEKYYRFSAVRRTEHVDLVRRVGAARIIWLDADGNRVKHDDPSHASYRQGERPRAEPEFPPDGESRERWTTVSGTYHVPADARQAVVELHFRWGSPHSRVEWANVTLEETKPLQPRLVRLAAVHHRPR